MESRRQLKTNEKWIPENTRGAGKICMRPGRIVSPDDRRAVLEMYESGRMTKDIAAAYNISLAMVSKIVRELGGRVRPKGPPRRAVGRVDDNGYRWVAPGAAFPFKEALYGNGQILEHRMVMMLMLGRTLQSGETVHHINGNRLDNRPVNLQLRQGAHGRGVAMCCADCGSSNLRFEALP